MFSQRGQAAGLQVLAARRNVADSSSSINLTRFLPVEVSEALTQVSACSPEHGVEYVSLSCITYSHFPFKLIVAKLFVKFSISVKFCCSTPNSTLSVLLGPNERSSSVV